MTIVNFRIENICNRDKKNMKGVTDSARFEKYLKSLKLNYVRVTIALLNVAPFKFDQQCKLGKCLSFCYLFFIKFKQACDRGYRVNFSMHCRFVSRCCCICIDRYLFSFRFHILHTLYQGGKAPFMMPPNKHSVGTLN